VNYFKKIYTAEGMLGDEPVLGELPSTTELYTESLRVASPAIADTVLVALISMMDTVMVSVLGEAAIAAVGITAQPRMIILALFMAMNTGLTAVVARRRGEENANAANHVLGQTLTMCFLLSLLLAALGGFYARPLLLFAGAQSDVINSATVYFQILMLSIPCQVITICINGAQRGCGNTQISMKVNLTANLVNIVFNYLLIGGNFGFPAWGVAGAAIATVIGNVVGLVMAILSVFGKNEHFLQIKLHNLLHMDKHTLGPVLSVGMSAGVEQIFLRVGFFLYVKIIASLGTTVMATHNICNSVLNVAFGFCDGLGMSAAALFGQSMGKRRNDLAILYCRACQRISLLFSALLFVIFSTMGAEIISLFSTESHVLELGTKVLMIIAVTAPIQASQFIYSSCLRSAGDTRYTAVTSMLSVGLLRPIAAWMLCYPMGFGLLGAWASYTLDQSLRFTLSWVRFRRGRWKKIIL
ncbi:MAG: MATE family efflux transporter, partial [Angelakisella sp.]